MTALIAGLAFGLIGSGHCAAMCGPLVLLANPKGATSSSRDAGVPTRLARHVALYHAGRAVTYLTLGGLAGLAGGAIAQSGFGRGLAVLAGAALLLQALTATGLGAGLLSGGGLAAHVTWALGRAGAWMRAHHAQGPVLFGALNGLLPCGLLYAALTAAAGLGDSWQALVFMGAFTAGTAPALAVLGIAGRAFTAGVPLAIRRAAPAALAVVGVLLIARGVGAPRGEHAAHGAGPTATSRVSVTSHQH